MARPMRTFRQFDAARPVRRAWQSCMVLLPLAACAQKVPKETSPAPAASSTARVAASVARPAPAQPARIIIPAAIQDACRSICQRSTELKCKNAGQCAANCVGMASLTPCSQPISALFSCLLREPLAHWSCAEDGVAAIREGYCDSEQAQAVTCMEAKMQQ